MAYDLELVNGEVKIKDTDERMLILPSEVVKKLSEEFYKILGPASKVVMREIGKCIGECVLEITKKEMSDGSLDGVLNAIARYLTRSGFGDVKIERDNGSIFIKIKKPTSLDSKTPCYLEQGIVYEVLKNLTGKRWNVKNELKGDVCVLEVSKGSEG